MRSRPNGALISGALLMSEEPTPKTPLRVVLPSRDQETLGAAQRVSCEPLPATDAVARSGDTGVGRPVRLRQAREDSGLHIAALAVALKVPVRKLEALEAGRYKDLPDMTFARALAASACRHLKVDPLPVLEQIPLATRYALSDSDQGIQAPFPVASGATNPVGWLARPALWAVAALLLAALVWLFLPDIAPRPQTRAADSAAALPVPAAADVARPPSLPAPAHDAAAAAVPVAAAVHSEPGLLSIRATGASWVQVLNAGGSVLIERTLEPGEVVDFSTVPPYSVVLGRADAVQVLVRGQVFDPMPHARNSVARFEVK